MRNFYKYKNKKNNIIYSLENILSMPMTEAIDLSAELNDQYNQIGFPTNSELRSSSNVVHVNAYTRDDGTQVREHWRSKPDGNGSITRQITNGIKTPTYPNGVYGVEYDTDLYQPDVSVVNNNLPDNEITKMILNKVGVPELQDGIFNEFAPSRLPEYEADNTYENRENPNPNPGSVFTKAPDYPVEKQKTNSSEKFKNLLKEFINIIGTLPQISVNNTLPNQTVFDNVNNIKFQPLNNMANINPAQTKLTNPNIDTDTGYNGYEAQSQAGNVATQIRFNNRNNPDFRVSFNPQNNTINNTLPIGLTFDNGIFAQPQSIKSPSAQHSQTDWNILAEQLKPQTPPGRTTKPQIQTGIHPVDFTKSIGKGLLYGFSDIGTGLGQQFGNNIRQSFGKSPLSEYEIANMYANVLGRPENGNTYIIAKFIGEIISLIWLPEITIVKVPLICRTIATILYQSIITSALNSISEKGISEDLKRDIGVGTTLGFALSLMTHNILRYENVTNYIDIVLPKIRNFINELVGLFVYRLKPAYSNANYSVSNDFIQTFSDTIMAKVAKNGGTQTRKVYRKPEKVPKNYTILDRKKLQLERLGQFNLTRAEDISIDEIKAFEEFNSALLFRNKPLNYSYTDYLAALRRGYVEIYSTYPFKRGGYVSTASNFLPKNPKTRKIYKRIVPIEDIAFMNEYEGLYAPVKHEIKDISNKPLQYKRKYVNNKLCYELILPSKEKGRITHEINTHMVDIVRKRKNIQEILEYSDTEYSYAFINKDYDNYIFIKKEINYATIK